MHMMKTVTLLTALGLLAAPSAWAEFQEVNTFEGGSTEGINLAFNPVEAEGGNGSIEIVADPNDATNNVLKLNPGTFANGTATNNVWFYLPIPDVTGTATIYTKFAKAGDIVDIVWGTTSKTEPLSYGDFSTIARVEIDGILDYHDGGYAEVENGATTANTWYHVWFVVDQAANTFDLWVQGGDQWTEPTRVADDAQFRLQSNDPLKMFMARMTTGDLTTPKATDPVYFDDIYVDLAGENVTVPGEGGGNGGGGGGGNGTGRLINIATRGPVGTGADVMIGGFVIEEGPRKVLIRGVGPTLATLGVPGTLTDPMIELYRAGEQTPFDQNDNWGDADNASDISAAASASGAFALDAGSADAALLVTLEAGGYTVHVKGVNDGTGVAIMEVYEIR